MKFLEFLYRLKNGFLNLINPNRLEKELKIEVEDHLNRETENQLRSGVTEEEARNRSTKQFGHVESIKEECRDSWGVRILQEILHDFRYGFRQLNKSRGFAAVAILTLAIGIGATTAIFSIVNSVLLQPMPYREADRLVQILQIRSTDQRESAPRLGVIKHLQQKATSFTSVTGSTGWSGNLTGVDLPVRIFGYAVTQNYLSTLGVRPLIGRNFLPEETMEGQTDVLILNHAFWLSQFDGDESVLNQKVQFNNRPYTIIGVMPPGFRTITGQLSSPKALFPLPTSTPESDRYYLREAIARLKPGISLEQAQAEIDVFAQQLRASDPEQWEDLTLRLKPQLDFHVGNIRPTLYILLGAVGFLLLIACVNVANLLLARASSRYREISLRSALGASRNRVVRQLLAESILLSIIGGALGILLAYASMHTLLAFAPYHMPRLDEVRIDGFALLIACAVTMLTGIGFGLVPALQATKIDLSSAMKEGGRSSGGGRQRARLRNSLAIIEVALAFVLLIGAGLFARTFANLKNADLGYSGTGLYGSRIQLLNDLYPDDQSRLAFIERAHRQLALQPGFVASAITTSLPYMGGGFLGYPLDIEARPEADVSQLSRVTLSSITTGFFETMNTPLLSGRQFNEYDRENTPFVAIIGENVANQHFPGESPIGKRIALVGEDSTPRIWREIVGVVTDIRFEGVTQNAPLGVYVPYRQFTASSFMMAVVKVSPEAPNPGPIVAAAIHKTDPEIPIQRRIASYEIFDAMIIAPQKFTMLLIGLFSAVALLLASLGIYGVLSYNVNQRTSEIGICMALGARSKDIIRPILTQGYRLVCIGLLIGILGALAGTKLIESMLYGVSPNDPLTLVLIAIVLTGVATLACYLPARRATKVDPMVALRTE